MMGPLSSQPLCGFDHHERDTAMAVAGAVTSLRFLDGRPHPTAGAFAEAQASTLARNIVA